VFDSFTGKWKEKGARSVEIASPFDPDRTMKMPASLLSEYNNLDFSDTTAVNGFLRKNGLAAYAIGKEQAPAGGSAPAGGTKLEQETEAEIKKKRAGSDIEQDTKDKTTILNNSKVALDVKTNATSIYNYAADPKTANAFGILAKPGVKNAFFKALEEPLRIGNVSLGVANIEDVMRTANGTQEEIEAAKIVGQKIGQLQVGFRKALQGQGSVSDREDSLVQRTLPMLNDSPKVMMLKSEIMLARATFDAENAARYQKWAKKHSNEYVRDYEQTPEYKSLVRHYENKLDQVETKYRPKGK
jgi:hypothetical protein